MLSVETLHCSHTSYFDPSTNQHSACMHPAMSLWVLIGLHISSSPEPLLIIIHKSCFSLSTTASASCFATLGEFGQAQQERPWGRTRTCCRDYISQLAWECLVVTLEELEEMEREVCAALRRQLPP